MRMSLLCRSRMFNIHVILYCILIFEILGVIQSPYLRLFIHCAYIVHTFCIPFVYLLYLLYIFSKTQSPCGHSECTCNATSMTWLYSSIWHSECTCNDYFYQKYLPDCTLEYTRVRYCIVLWYLNDIHLSITYQNNKIGQESFL